MELESHKFLDGKLTVYRRAASPRWQCTTFLDGYQHRQSTKQTSLLLAKEFAELWYWELRLQSRRERGGSESAEPTHLKSGTASTPERRRRRTPSGPTFREASETFMREFKAITHGQRNDDYVEGKHYGLNCHLLPFFGDRQVNEITSGIIDEYRIRRATDRMILKDGTAKPYSRSTLHKEIVTLRQVLTTAYRKGWITGIPDLKAPYKTSGKIGHRAWFSPDEYKMFYEATRERAKNPKKERWRYVSEQLHDYVLFMVNTGLRPDEASGLEYRDVTVVKDSGMGGERILEIEVNRGKRGIGYCKSMPGAVIPFQRVQKRHPDRKPTDRLFGKIQHALLNSILEELNLKHDRQGNVRTAYSLRHTYICLRLMEGADIYQIAKNCRTSVEMIEQHYATHIKNRIDTTAINMRKAKPAMHRKKTPASV